VAGAAVSAGLAAWLAGCGADSAPANHAPESERTELGLMTSLPLYWPLGAELSEIASGAAPAPWQRAVLEERHGLVLLDTLSPIAGLGEGDAESDPLAGLTRIAVIQPRGLSPSDNVALDDWVRGGGRLLLVLDPLLTGDYDLPLGDPRRPSDVALIPPVVARWGLSITFDEDQTEHPRRVRLGKGTSIPVFLAGTIEVDAASARRCALAAEGIAVRCRVGRGRVTLLADAAVFEDDGFSTEARSGIAALLTFAFD